MTRQCVLRYRFTWFQQASRFQTYIGIAVLASDQAVLLGDDSLLPGPWIAMLVEDGDELNRFITDAKVHRIGKSAGQRSSNLIRNLWKLKWTANHSLHHRVEFLEKLVAESGALVLVPRNRIRHIGFGPWLDNEASRHPLGLR